MSATPESDALDQGLQLVIPGKIESPGDGWTWVAEGWKLFARAPLMWVVAIVIVVVLAILVSIVPFIGSLAFQVAQPVLAGGFVAGCRSLENGGDFELEHLFSGFSKRFGSLAVVGLVFLAGEIVIFLVFALFVGFSVLGAFMTGDPGVLMESLAASWLALLLGVLVMLGLFMPLLAAYWFAPALVMIHDMKPMEAMKASFVACLRNFVPMFIYGLVMLVPLVVAMIPFGLGLLVWVPVAITSTYVAYRRIFTEG
ncbi:MAG: BPSS1780 family membrane protein [Usitatibacter sp.]